MSCHLGLFMSLLIAHDSCRILNLRLTLRNSLDNSIYFVVSFIAYEYEMIIANEAHYFPEKLNLADPVTKIESSCARALHDTISFIFIAFNVSFHRI